MDPNRRKIVFATVSVVALVTVVVIVVLIASLGGSEEESKSTRASNTKESNYQISGSFCFTMIDT